MEILALSRGVWEQAAETLDKGKSRERVLAFYIRFNLERLSPTKEFMTVPLKAEDFMTVRKVAMDIIHKEEEHEPRNTSPSTTDCDHQAD